MTTCDGSSRRSATATRPPHTLAGRIASGPDRRVALLALNVDERDALLDVLEEAERPALTELRGVLADDLAYRRGLG